jgi:hypothetical protein
MTMTDNVTRLAEALFRVMPPVAASCARQAERERCLEAARKQIQRADAMYNRTGRDATDFTEGMKFACKAIISEIEGGDFPFAPDWIGSDAVVREKAIEMAIEQGAVRDADGFDRLTEWTRSCHMRAAREALGWSEIEGGEPSPNLCSDCGRPEADHYKPCNYPGCNPPHYHYRCPIHGFGEGCLGDLKPSPNPAEYEIEAGQRVEQSARPGTPESIRSLVHALRPPNSRIGEDCEREDPQSWWDCWQFLEEEVDMLCAPSPNPKEPNSEGS